MSKRAVIVLRASMNAEDRTTLVTQESESRGYASSHDMIVVGVFTDDGRSGFKPGTPRPGFDAAMKMIQTGQADVLIVWKLDRLVRNLMSFVETWQAIQRAGGEFVSVVEQFDTTTLMGKLMLIIVATFAEMESQMKRDRALPWHEYRRQQGLPAGGPRPYGYAREKNALVLLEDEAAIIREMAEQVLAGDSLTSIVSRLSDAGIYGPYVDKQGQPIKLTLKGVRGILTGPTVAGKRKNLDGTFCEAQWDAILDDYTWEQVRTILHDPNRRTNFNRAQAAGPAYMLTAFTQCAECHVNMVRKNHPRGLRLLCRKCNSSLPMKVAEDAVTLWLMDNVDPDAWKALKEQGRGYDPDVVAALEAEMLEVAEMKAAGEINLAQFRVLNADLNARMAAATNDEPLDLPDISDLQSGWKELDLAGKRTIIMTLLESVQVAPHQHGVMEGRDRVLIERAV